MDNYIVSARKYRPSTFQSVVGQKALTSTLKNAVATNRLAHSYLFCGSRGVGKTSCARIFAKTINCSHRTADGEACNECESCRAFNDGTSMNIIELDAASNNGIDDMRALIEQVQVPPSLGQYRVFIVDEVHMLSTAAFNSFLKTLEEPPSYVIFILATTEKHKIIPTILSRCQIYDFHRITVQDMVDHLSYVASQEGITADPRALALIAGKADGAMRDALSIFDQVAASTRGNITYETTLDNLNILDHKIYSTLVDTFLNGDVLRSWVIYKDIRDRGFDSQFFINGLASHFRDLMVARDPSTAPLLEADDDTRQALAEEAARCPVQFIYQAMNLCNEADLNYRIASNKQFLIELTLAKLCQPLSPSPSNKSGNGEGQLRPITPAAQLSADLPGTTNAAPSTPTPKPQSAPAPHVTLGTPAAPAAPAPSVKPAQSASYPSSPAPVATPPTRRAAQGRVIAGAPRVFLHDRPGPTAAADKGSHAAAAPAKVSPITQEGLDAACDRFISEHPKEHILNNTMRIRRPELTAPDVITITVENAKQVEAVNEARPALLDFLHRQLDNDVVRLEVTINSGGPSRLALNDQELLQSMIADNELIKRYIVDFGLTLS